ncbi:MAG: DUF58 domain-containing protein [Bacteroidota bacterium]
MKEILRKIRKVELKTRRLVHTTFAGAYDSAFKGQGLEFEEVRPYQIGDDIRTIDWNVTAKMGQAYVKTYREEREQVLFLLVDISASQFFGNAHQQKIYTATEIAAILGFSALKNQDRVGLATFSEVVERFHPPKRGKKQVLAMLYTLLQQAPKHSGTSLKVVLDRVAPYLNRRSVLVVISDFISSDYEAALLRLSKRHEIILMQIFHPYEYMNLPAAILPIMDMESGNNRWVYTGSKKFRTSIQEEFTKRQTMLKRLSKRKNMYFVSIDISQDYLTVLEAFFKKRSRTGVQRGARS